jgi:hypothetical protein
MACSGTALGLAAVYHWRWRQYSSPKRWHLSTSLQGVKTLKNAFIRWIQCTSLRPTSFKTHFHIFLHFLNSKEVRFILVFQLHFVFISEEETIEIREATTDMQGLRSSAIESWDSTTAAEEIFFLWLCGFETAWEISPNVYSEGSAKDIKGSKNV